MSDPADPGILECMDVLDLSWGIAGPMTGMLLADHGARVTRIEPPAGDPFAEFSGTWEKKYPAIIRLWTNAWAEMVPFLAFDTEIRKIVCTTNAIESLNARFRRAVNARGHFPTDQAALKVLYLAVVSLDPTGKGRQRWTNRWKAALNAFDIAFDGRITANRR